MTIPVTVVTVRDANVARDRHAQTVQNIKRNGESVTIVTIVTHKSLTLLPPSSTPLSPFLVQEKRNTVTTVTTVTNPINTRACGVTVRKPDRHDRHRFASQDNGGVLCQIRNYYSRVSWKNPASCGVVFDYKLSNPSKPLKRKELHRPAAPRTVINTPHKPSVLIGKRPYLISNWTALIGNPMIPMSFRNLSPSPVALGLRPPRPLLRPLRPAGAPPGATAGVRMSRSGGVDPTPYREADAPAAGRGWSPYWYHLGLHDPLEVLHG